MVAYNKSEPIPRGTTVRVSSTAQPYGGLTGTVVAAPPGRVEWSATRPGVRLTWIQLEERKTPFGFYNDNLERIDTVKNTNLIGPKPEPVEEPQFVTPFRSDGANVVDANDTVVFRIQVGGYRQSAYRTDLPVRTRFELAQAAAEALTEKYGKVADSNSPF